MKKTILHENSHGVKMIRIDTAKQSKVVVCSDTYTHCTYRFRNITETFDSPFISWDNLDCCNGWGYDESYLRTAVQEGKKLYAGLLYSKQNIDNLSPGIITGKEKDGNLYICRTGKLADYYDLKKVFDFYKKLGLLLSDEKKDEIIKLCDYEIADFSNNLPYDYALPTSIAKCITTGLLLGYPLESTFSLITGTAIFPKN